MSQQSQGGAPSVPVLLATHLVLVVTTLAVLYPVLWVLKMALTPSQAFSMDPMPFPTEVSFQNFSEVIGTQAADGSWLFGRQLLNSLFVSAVTSALGITLACTAGYAMSRWAFPGRDIGMSMFLVTQMFPGVVMAIPLYILLDEAGLLNSMLGLALVYSTTAVPFSTWNLKGYFDTIPVELEEAALMDGASRWMTFTRIILPLARPALVVTALFSFMTAWNEFILAATFMSDERAFTLPVVLQSYVGDFGTEWGRFAAGSILVSLPVMLLFFALQRFLVEGLTAGSVKG
jgi:arabinogalactan oligomer/maltooligosaccharide transport system permease protein